MFWIDWYASLTEAKGGDSEEDGGNSGNLRLGAEVLDAVNTRKSRETHREGNDAGKSGEDNEDSSGNPVAGNAWKNELSLWTYEND